MSVRANMGSAAASKRSPAEIHVCPLAAIHTVIERTGARHLVTLIDPGTIPATPPAIALDRHLKIGVHDIVEGQPGFIAPQADHITQLIAFTSTWDATTPLLIHCFAGISRSTAAAFITACATRPDTSESDIARRLRTASPTATPNLRLVALADDLLGRRGRMVDAVDAIGSGAPTFQARPFHISI